MHISLDGFVAGVNGELNWAMVGEEIFSHVSKRISKSDTALYGRVTYRMMEEYWPTISDQPTATKLEVNHANWYAKVHKVVLSTTIANEPSENTEIISDNLVERINEIKQQRGEDILIFGSPTTTQSLMKLNLIDGYWLFVNPIVLGKGIRLFSDIEEKIKLELLNSRQFNCGVTELNYMVEKSV